MSWNLFNKPPLTFEVGYKDAQRQMNDLLDLGYSEDGAIDKLSNLYKEYCDPKSPTASWLPYGKGQDKYLEGYKAFLESVIQAPFSVPEQIHPETNVNLACDLLEFLSGPSLPSSLPSSVCVANKPDIGYIEAEIEYYKLLDKGFDIQAIYDWFHMNKVRITERKGFDYKAGFFLFINKKIVPAMELKAMYELKAYEKA